MKKMKHFLKNTLALVLLVVLSMNTVAQEAEDLPFGGKGKEKIAALKRAFFTEKLALTSDEAEKFWPLYNTYETKRDALRKEIRKTVKGANSDSTITDIEALEMIERLTEKRQQEVELDAQFLKDCLPVLGANRTMLLAKLEREFQKTMMQKLKERRQERLNKQGARTGGQGRRR